MSSVIFRAFVRHYAREIVRAMYAGILRREPGEEELSAYAEALEKTGDLGHILLDMASSREAWETHAYDYPEELVRQVYRGMLEREPESEALAAYAEELGETKNMAALLSTLGKSREHWEKHFYGEPEELVRLAFRGLLGREPEPEALAAYAENLGKAKDVTVLLSTLGKSREHWEKNFYGHPGELVRLAFRGLLGREPESEAFTECVRNLGQDNDLTSLLGAIGKSQEHWRNRLYEHPEELVRLAYRGVLRRNPDLETLKNYARQLEETKDLATVLERLSESQEHWALQCEAKHSELITAVYRGALGRQPDGDGLETYSKILREKPDIAEVIRPILNSKEFQTQLFKGRRFPNPSASYNDETWVFLHIQKTAGTSLQNMLLEAFNADRIYREHADTLYLRPPGELAQYTLFAGHFNHDTLSYIPRRELKIFAFVRDPKKRLISLYNFWRAHDPNAVEKGGGGELANRLDADGFFRHYVENESRSPHYEAIWNHMTWCIMGQRQWTAWRDELKGAEAKLRQELLGSMRDDVRRRLREFAFVGIQEDFERSCEMLFKFMGRTQPPIRRDHTLEKLSGSNPIIKNISPAQITGATEALLSNLVEIDDIIYEEAKILFAERLAGEQAATQKRGSSDGGRSEGNKRMLSDRRQHNEVESVLSSWVYSQLMPWKGKRLSSEEIHAAYRKISDERKDVFLFRINGDIVEVADKPNHYSVNQTTREADEYVKRARLYRDFFELVVKEYPSNNWDCTIAMSMRDETLQADDIPVFAYQKKHGSRAILLPDIDMLLFDFYTDKFVDPIPFGKKVDSAIFVGSTTGSMHTVDSVRNLDNQRIKLGVQYAENPNVVFRLPNIVQCRSVEAEAAIRNLGFGVGGLDWGEQFKYKFVISVDGNGATCSRVVIALKSNCVLLKFRSDNVLYYFSGLKEYFHYIPITNAGDVDDIIQSERGQPGLSLSVAKNGAEFCRQYLSRGSVLRYTAMLLRGYQGMLGKQSLP